MHEETEHESQLGIGYGSQEIQDTGRVSVYNASNMSQMGGGAHQNILKKQMSSDGLQKRPNQKIMTIEPNEFLTRVQKNTLERQNKKFIALAKQVKTSRDKLNIEDNIKTRSRLVGKEYVEDTQWRKEMRNKSNMRSAKRLSPTLMNRKNVSPSSKFFKNEQNLNPSQSYTSQELAGNFKRAGSMRDDLNNKSSSRHKEVKFIQLLPQDEPLNIDLSNAIIAETNLKSDKSIQQLD